MILQLLVNMKKYISCALLMLLAFTAVPELLAQPSRSRNPISRHEFDQNRNKDDEYRMSHLDGYAGDLIGIVLPQRLMNDQIISGRWDAAESERVKVVSSSANSANVRLLSAGTTVVNFKYKVMENGKEQSYSYPFTIRIHRIEPEVINLPSTLYLGWDVATNLPSQVKLLPEYSESPISFTVEDPNIADIETGYSETRIIGRQLGETKLYVETSNGLQAEARIVVVIPELRSIDIEADEKKMDIGEQMQLKVSLYPGRAQAQLTWSSDDPDICSVDENGVVTALKDGKAKIRVVSDNGKKDSISIKVKK